MWSYMFLMITLQYGNRCAPSSDPSLTIKFYERTPEQQAALGYVADTAQREPGVENLDGSNNVSLGQEEPHGSVGARAGRRAIAQGNSAEIADSLFRYSAPEEVHSPSKSEFIRYTMFSSNNHNTFSRQVMTFPSTCGACAASCVCRMFVTSILSIIARFSVLSYQSC